MCETKTWCTSWELNPGLNDGNTNNVRALAKVLETPIAITVPRTVAIALATSISIAVAIALSTWNAFVYGWVEAGCSVGGRGVGDLMRCEG